MHIGAELDEVGVLDLEVLKAGVGRAEFFDNISEDEDSVAF